MKNKILSLHVQCVEIGPTFAVQQTEHLVTFLRARMKWLLVSPIHCLHGTVWLPLEHFLSDFIFWMFTEIFWSKLGKVTDTVHEDLCTYLYMILAVFGLYDWGIVCLLAGMHWCWRKVGRLNIGQHGLLAAVSMILIIINYKPPAKV